MQILITASFACSLNRGSIAHSLRNIYFVNTLFLLYSLSFASCAKISDYISLTIACTTNHLKHKTSLSVICWSFTMAGITLFRLGTWLCFTSITPWADHSMEVSNILLSSKNRIFEVHIKVNYYVYRRWFIIFSSSTHSPCKHPCEIFKNAWVKLLISISKSTLKTTCISRKMTKEFLIIHSSCSSHSSIEIAVCWPCLIIHLFLWFIR